jgi:hypothetical protein
MSIEPESKTDVIETETDPTGDAPDADFVFGGDVNPTGAENDDTPETKDTPEDKTTAPVKKTTEPSEDSKGWDKERQRADQAEANLRKIQRDKVALEATAKTAQETADTLQAELNKILKANEVKVDDIDAEITDPKLLAVIRSLQSKVDQATDRAGKLEKKVSDYEAMEAQKAFEAYRTAERDAIVADVEADIKAYGISDNPVKLRNAAIARADEICHKRGYAPKDSREAEKMLKQCYMEIAKAEKGTTAPKKPIPADSGKGGSPIIKTEAPKKGSVRELANNLRARLRKSG